MRVLVLAKAPVAGRVKTRLGTRVGMAAAAEVAAAALLDTLATGIATVGAERCLLALDGELPDAVRGREIQAALAGWTVVAQRGATFASRLAAAHADAGPGPVAQIGMDTPQVTPTHLARVFTDLERSDAVLGPACDGGWWVLARHEPRHTRALAGVAMSAPTTYDDTWAALAGRGRRVLATIGLRDVDTVADAEAVAASAPDGRFAVAWRQVAGVAR